jgi:AcrR family transcriptional regulator
MQSAVRIFSRHGYENTSIAMVCKEAKVARGTLYQYYKNKHELFRNIVEMYSKNIQNLRQPMDLADPNCPSPRDFLLLRFTLMFEEVVNNKDI